MDFSNTQNTEKKNDLSYQDKLNNSLKLDRPNIFEYNDYRKYVHDYYKYLKSKNHRFSESAFIRKANFSSSSRGYFGHIIKGKRNLTQKTILAFSKAMDLDRIEFSYFDSLVHYGQAKDHEEKSFYLSKIEDIQRKNPSLFEGKSSQILMAEYRYFKKWYTSVIREMTYLNDFQNDPSWIVKKLQFKLSVNEIKRAIQDLIDLKLLIEKDGKLINTNKKFMNFDKNKMNNLIDYHSSFLDMAKESIKSHSSSDVSAFDLVIPIPKKHFEEMRQEIKNFYANILQKYSQDKDKEEIDTVIRIGTQMFKITNQEKRKINYS